MEDIQIGIAAVETASALLRQHFREDFNVKRKSRHDFVTDVDVEVEEAVIDVLNQSGHSIFGEESGEHPGDGRTWIVDPLDGTTNYILGNPSFSSTVALMEDGEVLCSAVKVPFTDDLFTAIKGEGAFLNGKPIDVSGKEDLSDSFLIFCHGKEPRDAERAVEVYKRFKTGVNDLRQIGSAGIEFATVAAGQAEGFVFPGAPRYDVAAGLLLVEEAGGTVTGFDGGPWTEASNGLVASNGAVHDELLQNVKEL